MPTDFSEVMAAATPREETVELCVDGALNSTFESLERRLRAFADWKPNALEDEDPRLEIAREMEGVREQMRKHSFVFTMRAISAKQWSDLMAAHPGRPEIAESFNQLTFPSALIAVCCVDPVMSVEQVDALFERLNEGQRNLLFSSAWVANHGGDVPFSRAASELLGGSGQK